MATLAQPRRATTAYIIARRVHYVPLATNRTTPFAPSTSTIWPSRRREAFTFLRAAAQAAKPAIRGPGRLCPAPGSAGPRRRARPGRSADTRSPPASGPSCPHRRSGFAAPPEAANLVAGKADELWLWPEPRHDAVHSSKSSLVRGARRPRATVGVADELVPDGIARHERRDGRRCRYQWMSWLAHLLLQADDSAMQRVNVFINEWPQSRHRRTGVTASKSHQNPRRTCGQPCGICHIRESRFFYET